MDSKQVPIIVLTDGVSNLSFRKALFWDVPRKHLDLKNNQRLIIERVFSRGNLDEYAQVVNYYSEKEITEVVTRAGNLDKKTLNFISNTYNINPKEMNDSKCIGRCDSIRSYPATSGEGLSKGFHPRWWNRVGIAYRAQKVR